MPQALADILSALDPIYKPQADQVNQQIQQLPQYYDAQRQGLGVAKDNAFTDITNQANARGVYYSGAPIDQQSRYVGATYLPAMAGLAKDQQDNTFKLQGALNDLNAKKYGQAQDIQSTQYKVETDAALKQQELAIAQAKAQAAMARYSAPKAPTAADQKMSAFSQLNQDLSGAFSNFKGQPAWYTEQKVIPALQLAYPELSPAEVQQRVYQFRKVNFGQ